MTRFWLNSSTSSTAIGPGIVTWTYREEPPPAGVREPRRPKPTGPDPAAAEAETSDEKLTETR